jgi:hypothetical protein
MKNHTLRCTTKKCSVCNQYYGDIQMEAIEQISVSGCSEKNKNGLQERIVYLECRCEQLRSAAELAVSDVSRLKKEIAELEKERQFREQQRFQLESDIAEKSQVLRNLADQLRQMETRRITSESEHRVMVERLENELRSTQLALKQQQRKNESYAEKFQDTKARAETLESAHERLFKKLFEWHSLVQSGSPEAVDLAEFIAELRAEVLSLERLLARSEAREAALSAILRSAGFEPDTESQIVSAAEQPMVVSGSESYPPQERFDSDLTGILEGCKAADRVLVEQFLRELLAGGATADPLTAGRLMEMLGHRAAPFVASLAFGIQNAEARSAMVWQLGNAADPLSAPVVTRFLSDASALVRACALDVVVKLKTDQPQDLLVQIREKLSDSDVWVRRRALIHTAALRGVDPGPLCSPLLSDPDAKIRNLACAALASTHDVHAAGSLLQALLDPDPSVVRAAANAAQKVLGPMAAGLSELPLAQRAVAVAKRRAYLAASAERLAPQGILVSSQELSRLVPKEFLTNACSAASDSPSKASLPSVPGLERIEEVLRTSIKGCTLERIALELQCAPRLLHPVINDAVGAQRLVRRGEKFFLP